MTVPKLALYSDQGAYCAMDERLMVLIGRPRPVIGYVSSEPDPQRCFFDDRRTFYAGLEAQLAVYVDETLDPQDRAWAELFGCDAIHLSGGNTFDFLHWLRHQQRLPALARYVAAGGVLIGVSAGAILMTPSVLGAELCGDERGAQARDDSALHLVDFHVWPHFDPAHIDPQQARLAEALPGLYGCEDGAGIIVDGAAIELHGRVRPFA